MQPALPNSVRIFFVFALAALLFGGLWGFLRTVPQHGESSRNTESNRSTANLAVPGRYHFVLSGDSEYIFDTQTARLWVRSDVIRPWEQEPPLPPPKP